MYQALQIRRTDSDSTPDPASLNIEVKVLPWTINLVDIIL